MFPQDSFQDVLHASYVEARLHNDNPNVNPFVDQILSMQDEIVGHRGLPVYVAMDPVTQEVLRKFELPTFDQEPKLLRFLAEERDQHWTGSVGGP